MRNCNDPVRLYRWADFSVSALITKLFGNVALHVRDDFIQCQCLYFSKSNSVEICRTQFGHDTAEGPK